MTKSARMHSFVSLPKVGTAALWSMLDSRPLPWCVNVPGHGTRAFKTLKEAAAVWKSYIRAAA